MPLTPEDIRIMDHRGVTVSTHTGIAIGLGSLRVSEAQDGAGLRVDLHFETTTMRCVLGIPPARLEPLVETWNGSFYRYSLPPGDKVWLPAEDPTEAKVRAHQSTGPVIETFPLPTTHRPSSVAPAKP